MKLSHHAEVNYKENHRSCETRWRQLTAAKRTALCYQTILGLPWSCILPIRDTPEPEWRQHVNCFICAMKIWVHCSYVRNLSSCEKKRSFQFCKTRYFSSFLYILAQVACINSLILPPDGREKPMIYLTMTLRRIDRTYQFEFFNLHSSKVNLMLCLIPQCALYVSFKIRRSSRDT